ncbi:hypothetical protein AVEN_179560-1 [Araneus ventricosus]|uniref:Uncharacterized protein n=1 Tax=Araneus ventricosus TaxID=182803 RepID=A0A4Y2BBT2_ARAVE|nr:hypothetical protein AVEN_179560-1 [Araneus ventricosus]
MDEWRSAYPFGHLRQRLSKRGSFQIVIISRKRTVQTPNIQETVLDLVQNRTPLHAPDAITFWLFKQCGGHEVEETSEDAPQLSGNYDGGSELEKVTKTQN